jgi:MFS transporter, PPP family, 3-phenylpropionic acid transporter
MKGVALRLAFAQAATGLIGGATAPFFSAWLAARGFHAPEIAVLQATGRLLLVVVGPLSGLMADARNDRRAMMLVLYAAMFTSYAVLDFTTSTTLIFMASIAATVCGSASWPLLESVSVRLSEHHRFDYGHVRVWGSAVFVAANLVSGVVKSAFGIEMLPAWLTVALALNLLAVFLLPAPSAGRAPIDLGWHLRATFAEARELTRSLPFLLFLAAASLDQGSHAFYYTYGGLHWLSLGYSGWLVGAIWPLGILAEIGLMSFSLPVFRYLGSTKLLLIAAAACAIRWTVLAFDPPLPIVIAAQFLHGATFAMAHLGAMYFILKAVPPRLAATAQSLYAVGSSGIVMGLATLASGPLYAAFGGRAYLLMSAMGLGAMLFAWLLGLVWDGERVTSAGSGEIHDAI